MRMCVIKEEAIANFSYDVLNFLKSFSFFHILTKTNVKYWMVDV